MLVPSSLSETNWIVLIYIVQDSLLQSDSLGTVSSPLWQRIRQNLLGISGLKSFYCIQLPNTIKAHFIYYANKLSSHLFYIL